MNIGIISGTFDPIHEGHIELIKKAQQKLGLDKIIVLIEKNPRGKKYTSAYQDRVEMAKLAIDKIDNAEVREAQERQHSIETLKQISRDYKDAKLYILLGADTAKNLDKWQSLQNIKKLAELIVFSRAGHTQNQDEITFNHPASSANIRGQIQEDGKPGYLDPQVLKYIHERGLYRK